MHCSSEQRSRAPDCRCRDFAVNVAIFTNLRRDFFLPFCRGFLLSLNVSHATGYNYDSTPSSTALGHSTYVTAYLGASCYIAAWIQQTVQWTVLRSEVREKKVTNHQHQPISQTDARTQGGAYLVTFDKQVSK